MADTTIGYAVLQIIPSLKGVSEAINKQLEGQTVAVTVEPKTDVKKVDQSVRDAVKKSKKIDVELEPKVDPVKVDKTVRESVKKAKPPKVELEPKIDPGRVRKEAQGAGKALRDTINESLQDAANDMGMPVEELKKQLSEKLGTAIGSKIGEALGNTDIGQRIGQWADSVRPALEPITAALGAIRDHDAAGAVNGLSDALQNIGQTNAASSLTPIATKAGELQTTFNETKTGVQGLGEALIGIGAAVPAFEATAASIGAAATAAAGPIAALVAVFLGTKAIADEIVDHNNPYPWHARDRIDSPVPAKPGVPIIPMPGQAPAFEPPTAKPGVVIPPGVKYSATPGSLDPFAIFTPPGSQPPSPTAPIPVPVPVVPVPVPVPNPQLPNLTTSLAPPDLPGRAGGGMADVLNGVIRGPGTGTSDSILGFPAMVRVSNEEFVVNADDTKENLPALQAINSGVPLWDWIQSLPAFGSGGLVAGSEQLRSIIGQRFGISNIGGYRPADKYGEHSTGRALDVMISDKATGDAVKDFALANAAAIDLKWVIWRKHLYYPGGGGYEMEDRGSPTQNHMDHVHIFSGPGITNGLLGALQGSTAPKGKGDDASTPAGLASTPAGLAGTGVAAAGAPAGAAGGSGGFAVPSSLSGMAGFGLNNLGAGIGATSSGSDLSVFGNAAGAAVGGQVSSALSGFGIGDSPGWLQGISKFVGGMSFGGGPGGGASVGAAAAAIPTSLGGAIAPAAGLPGGALGAGGGRLGAQTIFNIQTARVEDAFIQAESMSKVKALSKLEKH